MAKKTTKDQNRTEQHKKAVLEALEKSLGIVTVACKAVGIGRTQYYEWLNTDEEFKAAVEDLSNVALDFAESKLHENIQNNDTTACIFYLKTKGKKRGYGDQMALDHSFAKMPDNVQIGLKVHKNKEE